MTGEDKKTFQELMKSAEQGDAEAQNSLGLMYNNGEGVTQDSEKAVEWFKKATEQGHAEAQFFLGTMCFTGEGGLKGNKEEGVKWIKKSAEQGHAEAQFLLGTMFGRYEGKLEQNIEEGKKWLRKAADQGHASAQDVLKEIEEFEKKTNHLLSAEEGDARAQFVVAGEYYSGICRVQDTDKAIFWYKKAAEQGYIKAYYMLGVIYDLKAMHDELSGVTPSNEAVKWLQKAVKEGDAGAQFQLGEIYEKGRGVKKDEKKGMELIKKAAEQGNEEAKSHLFMRDLLKAHTKTPDN